MKEFSEEEIGQLLEGESENLNLEFKSDFNFENDIWAREKLIRAIFAISNTETGGRIIVGITENEDKSLNFTGVQETNLSAFRSKEEILKAKVESFSSSPANYELGYGSYKNKKFILINIHEFSVNPLICRHNGEHKDKILEEGAIYIRALNDKPSSIKLTNPIDIQDFLERLVDKQIIHLHKRGWNHKSEKNDKAEKSFKEERNNF